MTRKIMASLLAAAVATAFAGAAEAQTKYFVRTRLTTSEGPAAAPPPMVYNTIAASPSFTNTRTVNGCASGEAGYKTGFASFADARSYCTTVKAAQKTYMYCRISTVGDETKQVNVYSSDCAPGFSGNSNAYRTGDGWYSMQPVAGAY